MSMYKNKSLRTVREIVKVLRSEAADLLDCAEYIATKNVDGDTQAYIWRDRASAFVKLATAIEGQTRQVESSTIENTMPQPLRRFLLSLEDVDAWRLHRWFDENPLADADVLDFLYKEVL